MKTIKMNLKDVNSQLSREEMREIMAGSGDCGYYNCQCQYNPGVWTGYYCSSSQVGNALNSYCYNGYGYCQ